MAIRLLLYIGVIILFVSCQESRKEHINRLVKEWEKKEIVFPKNPTFTILGNDTVDFMIKKSNYKVVVYVDSTGCVSCKLRLKEWKEFIAYVDSVSGGQVPFLFFFQSKDNKELRYILKRDNFRLPVCVDSQNEFGKLNRFPSELMFQTFLLDKENRVKVIGNPIHNLSVKELYLKEIAGIKETEALALTQLVPDREEYDLGIVAENETKKRKVLMCRSSSKASPPPAIAPRRNMTGKRLPRTNKKRWLCLIRGKSPVTSGARLRFMGISPANP